MLRGYSHVVEDAKTHAAVRHGVVSGRPYQSKGAVIIADCSVHCRYGSTRRHQGGVV